jgi:hypothetical protein
MDKLEISNNLKLIDKKRAINKNKKDHSIH